jgi:anthraniloyl-CoA monooxygenase
MAAVTEREKITEGRQASKINVIGGGPGGLYFAILHKLARPNAEVTVWERNRPDDTFGFGVVFSDATLQNFADADPQTYREITENFAHWDDIDIHVKDELITSTGHGFSGLSRKKLLQILQRRAVGLGVALHFEHETDLAAAHADADLIVAADGINSAVRDLKAEQFQPRIEWRGNKFIWLGTTCPFPAFTFIFKESKHGLWRVHAYQFDREQSTVIFECTEATWRRAGLDEADEAGSIAYLEDLFAEYLNGHPLIQNNSPWRNFPIITNGRWHYDNVVLMGDAVHSAHFSIGSGTKLAMEDAIALNEAMLSHETVPAALAAYETERRPDVESTQRAAKTSLMWFENVERYYDELDTIQFAFSLLTRSLRISHDNLRVRDPAFTQRVDQWFAEQSAKNADVKLTQEAVPPMFTPFRLRDMLLENRVVVSPMCQYSAADGTIDDWHLVHLGSRAVGGAGLLITEMTDVSRDGRISPGCAGMYRPDHIPAWRRVTDFVHAHSVAKIGLQLAHAGRKGSTKLIWEGMDQPLEEGNWPLLAASPIPYTGNNQVPKEMDRTDMDAVTADFVRSTEMAIEANFDLVEVHFAHGYLLSTFLSPLTNRRTDAYGGDLDGRMRYPLEVFEAVRAVWPDAKPMSVRISATDWAPGGFAPAEAVLLARALKARGCDIVDVSAGQVVPEQEPEYGRLFQTRFSDQVRLEAAIPTMTVGNISSYEDVNSILAAGRADLCVLARAHLYDPYWTRHAAQELGYPLPWPDQYSSIQNYTPRFKS